MDITTDILAIYFDKFNKAYFDGKLPVPRFAVTNSRTIHLYPRATQNSAAVRLYRFHNKGESLLRHHRARLSQHTAARDDTLPHSLPRDARHVTARRTVQEDDEHTQQPRMAHNGKHQHATMGSGRSEPQSTVQRADTHRYRRPAVRIGGQSVVHSACGQHSRTVTDDKEPTMVRIGKRLLRIVPPHPLTARPTGQQERDGADNGDA